MAMIKTENLKKSFDDLEVLKGVDFSMEKGEITAVLGASGSGKSTFLRCLIDLEKVQAGSIWIEGEPLVQNGVYPSDKTCRKVCSKMGMVFQHFNLFPHMTVQENLTMPAVINDGMDKKVALEKCRVLLEKVGLADKENAHPSMLSGGQKQRVAIARALMRDPHVLLFDEPTSSLDPEIAGEVLEVIQNLAMERAVTMIIVTHQIGFAREVASRVVFMENGKVLADGTPSEVIDYPESERVKTFLKKVL